MVSQAIQDKINDLESMVEQSVTYFQENADRYKQHMNFVFVDSLLADQTKLADMGMPQLKFNSLEAIYSRLLGEFSEISPEAKLLPKNDAVPSILVETVTNILRGIFYKSDVASIRYKLYQHMLGGGFDYAEVYTEYENERSFDQEIKIRNVFDATLCGADPYATDPAKSNGRYIYTMSPLYEDDFKQLFPDVDINQINYTQASTLGFNWFTKSDVGQKVIYVCELYLKEKKRLMLHDVRLSDGSRMTLTNEEFKALDQEILLNQPTLTSPKKVKSEMRTFTKICKYTFIKGQVLDYIETDFDEFPIKYFGGNSITIENQEITKSYGYNAIDAQRAKNIVANCFLDELTNYRRTTVIASARALPLDNPKFMKAYEEPSSKYASFIFNDIDDDGNPITPPSVLPRDAIPPELYQTFISSDDIIQSCLGAYDAQLGIQQNDLSGNAILKGATQSNSASKPFVINFMASWTQLARMIVNMIPKYYKTPRTIPIVDKMGKRKYQKINYPNDPDSISMDFDPNVFDVYVEAGPSFQLQKQEAIETLSSLAQTNAGLNAIISSPQGVDVLLDNLDIMGTEKLKEINDQMQQKAQEQAQAQQGQQPPDPMMMIEQAKMQQAQQKMQQDAQQAQLDHQVKMAQVANDQQSNQLKAQQMTHQQTMDYLQLLAEREKAQAEIVKAQDESDRANAELRLKHINTAIGQYQFHVNKTHELKRDEQTKMEKENESQSET